MKKRLMIGLLSGALMAAMVSVPVSAMERCTVSGSSGDDFFQVGDEAWEIAPDAVVCGGHGNDTIFGGDFYGTFHGGHGDDQIIEGNLYGTFHGGHGDDAVGGYLFGTFLGGHDDDQVGCAAAGSTFDGGHGFDVVIAIDWDPFWTAEITNTEALTSIICYD